jgi:hypothetical protein
MKDELPLKAYKNECGILNLDESKGNGTHWVCYRKANEIVQYFDSFGNLPPPLEFISYVKNCEVYYNRNCFQNNDSVICGHLCLLFLLQ